jgi:KaiC/GvpD/RAD55 family RecA-like ATPase
MEKTKTGIEGFDELVDGGFFKGHSILLSGTPGTGKTIFALQFLYNGAINFNENGLLITFEEKINDLRNQAKQFGWDFNALEKDKKLTMVSINPQELTKDSLDGTLKLVEDLGIKRMVIDSLSTLSIHTPIVSSNPSEINEYYIKRFIYNFVNQLKGLKNTTSLLISQNASEDRLSSDNISEFMCDGVIHLTYESMGGEFSRSIIIRKMRQTKNDEDVHPLEISDKGLVVHNIS